MKFMKVWNMISLDWLYIYVIDGKKSIFLVVLAETLMQTTLDKEHKDKIITYSV